VHPDGEIIGTERTREELRALMNGDQGTAAGYGDLATPCRDRLTRTGSKARLPTRSATNDFLSRRVVPIEY
jgi:hypothetical protein